MAENKTHSSAVINYRPRTKLKELGRRLKKHRSLLIFVVPAVVFTLVFSYIPMLGVLFSFKGGDFNLYSGDVLYNITHGVWNFDNYLDLFDNPDFFRAVSNTLIINLIKLGLCFPLSIIIAVMLSELKNQTVSKTVLIIICLPNFLSWAVVIGIWSGMLDAQGGVLHEFLQLLHIIGARDPITQKDSWFKGLAIFYSAWKGAGWGSIMFYAAIMAIDKTFYESAKIDGASKIKQIFSLTIPTIMPTIALMLVLNISGIMDAGFEQIYTMMNSNQDLIDSQNILGTLLFEMTKGQNTNIPAATALGVFNGAIALMFMLVGNFITKKTLKRSLW